jgi:cytochrome c
MVATKRSLSGTIALCAVLVLLATAALSLVHPWGNLRSSSRADGVILADSNAPEPVRKILAEKCGDCHSANTRWPLYSRIAPSSWLVEHDVKEGREHMNLSTWDLYSIDNRIDLLAKIATQLRQGKMPLKQYLLLHPDARLSDEERKLVVDWTKTERKRLIANAAK